MDIEELLPKEERLIIVKISRNGISISLIYKIPDLNRISYRFSDSGALESRDVRFGQCG